MGRTSTGSVGRQHPVNSICMCSRCVEQLNDLHSSRGYKSSESPHSTHSEVGKFLKNLGTFDPKILFWTFYPNFSGFC